MIWVLFLRYLRDLLDQNPIRVKSERKKRETLDEFLSLCTPAGVRTLDPLIKSQMLYQLSYKRILFSVANPCFPICGCKGTHFLSYHQNFSQVFFFSLKITHSL